MLEMVHGLVEVGPVNGGGAGCGSKSEFGGSSPGIWGIGSGGRGRAAPGCAAALWG
jgi:hypothetical protein